jgi:hypothetical protein
MNFLYTSRVFACTIFATIVFGAHGFGILTPTVRRTCATTTTTTTTTTPSTVPPLFGILDDMMSENNKDDDSDGVDFGAVASEEDEAYEEFFQNLIFSAGGLRNEIANQLEACTQPEFLQYLSTTLESSDDAEERQGLQELLDMINEVQRTIANEEGKAQELADAKRARQEQLENTAAAAASSDNDAANNSKLSDAEVVKRANAIDQAFTQAELSDDEKPSDFISDCREVVNLSRGFNDRGKMRVGG